MKKYELSISRNYVSAWTVSDAIREILQNAIDAKSDGYEMEVYYKGNTMVISTIGTTIDPSTLVLGCGNKTNDSSKIGGFSEGYKLALLVLTREGICVEIYNGDELWIPVFEKSEQFKTEVLKIESRDIVFTNSLTFMINPVSESMHEEFNDLFPCIEEEYGDTIKTDVGDLLLEERFRGKIFVGGLFVQEDNNFRYGYNFDVGCVSLDRDRKAINYYTLKRLTAVSLISAEECNIDVFNAILSSCTEARDIISNIDSASNEFALDYKYKFFKKYKLVEGTIVATSELCKLLERKGYTTFVGSEISSYIIAKADNLLSLLRNTKDELSNKNEKSDAWQNFQDSNYRSLLIWFYGIQRKLNEGDKKDFKNIVFDYDFYKELSDEFYQIEDDVFGNIPDSLDYDYIQREIDGEEEEDD